MSHFTVMVIGDNPDEQLAPFHEFECTGVDDQYVQDIDITEKVRDEWMTDKVSRLRAPDGTLHIPYADEFYRVPTDAERAEIGPIAGSGGNGTLSWHSKDWGDGRGYSPRILFVPDGWEKVDVPKSQVMSFEDVALGHCSSEAEPIKFGDKPQLNGPHKYGYVMLAEDGTVAQVINRTNPNKKWDWYQVGGRWSGMLRLKPGRPGILGRTRDERPQDGVPRVDSARKGDIDWDGMRDAAEVKARALWTRVRAVTGGASWDSWDDTRLRYKDDVKRARDEYWDQPALSMIKAAKIRELLWDLDDDLALDLEIYVARRRAMSITTFAMLKHGEWIERGEMLMFGQSIDAVSPLQWAERIASTIDGLPDDTLVTIVDCHI